MSASLVGSEMCIRDSSSRVGWRTRPAQHLEAARARRRPAPAVGRRSVPVSYTHLTLPTICSV
eukprot:10220811-Alexandrium_andersonii.AAC.1